EKFPLHQQVRDGSAKLETDGNGEVDFSGEVQLSVSTSCHRRSTCTGRTLFSYPLYRGRPDNIGTWFRGVSALILLLCIRSGIRCATTVSPRYGEEYGE